MRWILALTLCFFTLPAFAQDDDQGYLAAFLEENLSGAGRDIKIIGFSGALSSKAAIESLTIADADGIWITLNGVVLDWSRSALLSGEVIVNELSAQEIIIARAPKTEASTVPTAEAQGFSLPELPVSIEIGRIAAERIVLEPALMGSAIEGSLEASLSLSGGQGKAKLTILRTDAGPSGRVTLDAGYVNETRQLEIALSAAEGKDGIAATLLGIPGTPATELTVKGSGPLDAFAADIALSTDDVDRLQGSVTLAGAVSDGTRFGADLSGDLAPLFLPEYAAFFGDKIALKLDGLRKPDGALTLSAFDLTTRSLALSGSASLASDGLPEQLTLHGKLASPDGTPVLLPIGGTVETRVDRANVDLTFSAETSATWQGSFVLTGLDRADFRAEDLALSGTGLIGRTGDNRLFEADLSFNAKGLRPDNAALSAALGRTVGGSLKARWLEGSGALSLSDVRIDGENYAVSAAGDVEGLAEGLNTKGSVTVAAEDFSRFSGLAGRQLGGAGQIEITGSGSRLSGFFDLVARFAGQGLRVGVDQIDRLLEGQSQVSASVMRDDTGTTVRAFDFKAKTLAVSATGKLATSGAELAGQVVLGDLGDVDDRYRGSLKLDATFSGTVELGRIVVKGAANGLGIGNPQIDRLLAGTSDLEANVALRGGDLQVENLTAANPQVTVRASGQITNTVRSIKLNARLNNLALLVPEFPGPLTVEGTAVQDGIGYQVDLSGTGPGEVRARVSGRLADDFGSADLTLSGTAQAGLANAFIQPRSISGPLQFNLQLSGPLELSSLSGRVSLSDGRLTAPFYKVAFERMEVLVELARGQGRLSVTSQLATGGRLRIDGPIGLSTPYSADLAVQLDNLVLIDPELYRTLASGTLTVKGPMTGGAQIAGRINLGETEIRVPSSGIGTAAGFDELNHANEPGDVRATRARAGLLGGNAAKGGSGQARPFGLDIVVSAPSKVFLRGRGIDAELGGELRIGGTSANVTPSGGLRLIRGRLDILGKRLVLSEASLRMQGNFVPDLQISASNESDGITSFINVSGPASDPVVSFSSTPELPQEEVLSRLLFGRGLDSISALQAAQLASAVASLAGRGGEGVVSKLRKSFGLDDLDVATADDGSATLKAGKYLTENIYTEIEVDQSGSSQINLNLDVRPGVTVKGRVGADGETGLGIFLERNY